MKLAVLFGLKIKLKPGDFPASYPGTSVLGTFPTIEEAQTYVQAGGMPNEFPYYAIAVEEGGFWIVGSRDMTEEEMNARSDREFRPFLLAGPFESPMEAMARMIRIDASGWRSVSVQCTSTAWVEKCPRAEVQLLERPSPEWARARLERWRAADDVGEVAVTLYETGGFMEVVRDWMEAGYPGTDDQYEKELVEVGKQVAEIHRTMHAKHQRHVQRARGREGRQ